MEITPKVSIIIPVYNAQNTLKRCVDSVLSQSFKDFELILIDDGSTDESPQIIDRYALEDNRVIPIHKPNGGVSSARNAGIEAAIGKYIVFVDSDDEVLDSYLADFESFSDDLIMSGVLFHRADGSIELEAELESTSWNESVFNKFIDKYFNYMSFRGPYAKAFRREIINKENIRFDESMFWGEDTLFTLAFLRSCNSVSVKSSASYIYYIPTHYGKYKLPPQTLNSKLRTMIQAINYFGKSEEAVNFIKNVSFLTYIGYEKSLSFSQRISNHLILCIHGTIALVPGNNLWDKFKRNVELARITLLGR